MAGNDINGDRHGGDWYRPYGGEASHPLWLDVPLAKGDLKNPPPREAEIVVIGSGLSGASAAYWLAEKGFSDVLLLDWRPDDAATNRNCGHILYGTVESAEALVALKGEETARSLLSLSVDLCHGVRDTISRLGIDCDYRQNGYLVMGIDDHEAREIGRSVDLLNRYGIENRLVSKAELLAMGYRDVSAGRFELGGARAHPVKFRNGIVGAALRRGVRYHSGVRVLSVDERGDHVVVVYDRGDGQTASIRAEAAVVAANAYSPLFSDFFSSRRLVEPFRGQIIASAPLRRLPTFAGAQSFDHGYEYAVFTEDRRLVIGGWRNHTPGGEVGTYDLGVNREVEAGLRMFAARHMNLGETPTWTHSWSGIMAASKTGLPFIGPTASPRIFALAGYTGHGFSWAHGSARILASIMAGDDELPPKVLSLFNPRGL